MSTDRGDVAPIAKGIRRGPVLGALALLLGCRGAPPGAAPDGPLEPSRPLIGGAAPAIERLVLAGEGEGELFDWDRVRGRVLIVDFWATWCAPCRRSLPYLQALADREPTSLSVIGVCEDDLAVGVPGFARRYGLRFPLVWDRGGEIADAYRVTGLPTTVVVDRGGLVRQMRAGFRSADAAELEALLADLGATAAGRP